MIEVIHLAAISRNVRRPSRSDSLAGSQAYQLFRRDASHPGLNFKKVDRESNVYSARVGMGYRALRQVDGEEIVWFWIGPHSDYDKIV